MSWPIVVLVIALAIVSAAVWREWIRLRLEERARKQLEQLEEVRARLGRAIERLDELDAKVAALDARTINQATALHHRRFG